MRYGLLLSLCLLLAGCFGGATETETGTAMLSGKAQYPDGRPAVGALIRLRPNDFVASSADALPAGAGPWDTLTDAKGRFAFDTVPVGEFTVEALYGEGQGVLLRFAVEPATERIDLDPLVLRSTALLTGRVRFSDSSRARAILQIPGTGHIAETDSATGFFKLWDVPPGDFSLRVSTASPFFPAKVFPAQVPEGGPGSLDLGDLILDKAAKQEFAVAGGALTLAGIGAGNPVLYDNDFCLNTWDNELLWALNSMGRIDLRGSITTRIMRDSTLPFPEGFPSWEREAEICRLSGMRNIPQTVSGATRKLALPASGRWEDYVPESNAGIQLLLAEARKASAAKPLIVLEGGALTTVANALLLDPSIADKMVIFGIYNQDLNGRDSLATFMVAKKCRFVEWGRDYRWAGPAPTGFDVPGNWLGARLGVSRDTTKAVKDFFADFAGLAYLIDPHAWKSARGANLTTLPMNVTLGSQGPFDIVDVPQDANDWNVMENVFFSTFGDSAAYHPWPVPGAIAGVSFRGMSGVSADSLAAEGYIVKDIGAGDWMDYPLEAAAEGEYDLAVRFQCDTPAQVRVSGPDAASADLQLAAGAAWGEAQARIHLKAGTQTLRLATSSGAWKLAQLKLNPGP